MSLLQVGQALVIALSIALNDVLYITLDVTSILGLKASGEPRLIGVGLARGSTELSDRHLFSLYLMLPLIGVCFGLLKHNWYEPRMIRFSTASMLTRCTWQVPVTRVHRRHVLLLQWNGFRRRGHPRTLLKDASPLLCTPNLQFRVFNTAIVWDRAMPTSSTTSIERKNRSLGTELGCDPTRETHKTTATHAPSVGYPASCMGSVRFSDWTN